MTKLKQIRENKAVRYLLIGIGALVLLLVLWKVFGSTSSATSVYEPTQTESRIVKLLSGVEGVSDATVLIAESDGEAVSAVVVYEGEDSILVRMRILDITSAALNINKSNVQVYPAG